MVLGYMPMPANFRYREVALRGRPQHKGWDAFSIKHPPMPASRWAKIFSPFDALKGFSEAVSSKEVQYVSRIELDADAEAELSRKLEILRNLTWNGRMAKANHVMISVKYFVPCQDVNNFAFGNAGLYERREVMQLTGKRVRKYRRQKGWGDGRTGYQKRQDVLLCFQRRAVIFWMTAVEEVTGDADKGRTVRVQARYDRRGIRIMEVGKQRQVWRSGDMVDCLFRRGSPPAVELTVKPGT